MTELYKKAVIVATAVIVIVIILKNCGGGFVEYGPGEVAPNQPVQINLKDAEPFEHKGCDITPAAEFDITARVLAKKRYRFDREAKLSPFDFAMGWGPMSDETNLDEIDIKQSGRFYRWWTDDFPIPRAEIERNSANMHLIPADDSVYDVMKDVKAGNVVHIKGYLVKIRGEKGSYWNSSMTRNDTGAGACEVIWVKELEIIDPVL